MMMNIKSDESLFYCRKLTSKISKQGRKIKN